MSDRRKNLDQCPSTLKSVAHERAATPGPAAAPRAGRRYWRSLDEVAGKPEFVEFLQREFPAYASELLDGSRRHFLRIMGASLALAGAAGLPGCRRPDHKILTYAKDPEHLVIGKALYYATAMPLPGGGCEGLLAECHEGRPTKLEGNPLHRANHGKSSVWSQASILDLYDPDRDPATLAQVFPDLDAVSKTTPWDKFLEFSRAHFQTFDQSQGAGLVFLVEKATSPSRDLLRDRIAQRWPKAKWLAYEPVDDENALAGAVIAFGRPMREELELAEAKVIVSLDRDFLGGEGCSLQDSRGFAAGRFKPGTSPGHTATGSSMSRLYSFEAMMTLTGGQADHRYRVKASRIGAVAAMLGRAVLERLRGGGAGAALASTLASGAGAGGAAGPDLPGQDVIDAVADDLCATGSRGSGVIVAGPSQPPAVHALVHALNAALGNAGKTVRYLPLRGDAAQISSRSIAALSEAMGRNEVETLVVVGCNPMFDAPAELGFAEKFARVRNTIHLGALDETAFASKMHVQRCHWLESWGDVEHWDGTYSIVQPMIKPLFPSVGELEFLAAVLGEGDTDPYNTVRATFRARTATTGAALESRWRRALHDGLLAGSTAVATALPSVNMAQVTREVSGIARGPAAAGAVEVVFIASPHVHDGRAANNGWLQELPHAVTKLCWDNPALVSPQTARDLGLSTDRHPVTQQYCHGQVVTLEVDSRRMDIPIWVQPGLADGTIVLHVGYGRSHAGRIGRWTGFNTFTLRTIGGARVASVSSASPNAEAEPYLLANTQDHWTMEGRDFLREVDLPAWQKHGDSELLHDERIQLDPYDRTRNLNFAGLLGTEGHTPANKDIYKPWQKLEQGLRFTEQDESGEPLRDERGNIVPIHNKYGKPIQQWGMSIDMTTCTGCGACVVACQAENNVPIVGKKEVAKGREMHWIRVDRYYAEEHNTKGIGGDDNIGPDPGMFVQAVACVHCENAPCEVVCPVNATSHDREGNNNMAYNRCIGTRYCSNNCPYKVRRFNFFDYATKQFRGDYAGKEFVQNNLPEVLRPPSENFVPPRLRQLKLEISTMQSNPRVTVRSRGVMEKCTYCIQRVNTARVETKIAGLERIPDGYMQTACQQACPTDAIVFGDIYDHDAHEGAGSRVKRARNDGRSYAVLSFLNVRPRTTHMLRVRNPNPRLRKPVEDPFHHAGGHDSGHARRGRHGRDISLPVLAGAGVMA